MDTPIDMARISQILAPNYLLEPSESSLANSNGISHPCAFSQFATLHPASIVGEYPEDTITLVMRKACHFQVPLIYNLK